MDDSVEALKAMVTSPDEFKRPHPVVLPSGRSVLIRQVSLYACLRSGVVPNPLIPVAYKYLEGTHRKEIEGMSEEQRFERTGEVERTVDIMCCAVIYYPETVLEREEEEGSKVWIGRYSEQDKVTLLQLAQAGVSTLASFRPPRDSPQDRPYSPALRRFAFRRRKVTRGKQYLRAV